MKRFSLHQLYNNGAGARRMDGLLLFLVGLLILAVPLPFGSVEASSILAIELAAAVCFLLWLTKLLFFADPDQLSHFRSIHKEEREQYKRTPFFHRFPLLGLVLRIFTLGKWPRKNPAANMIEGAPNSLPQRTFFSVIGFPVRNTGMEMPALLLFTVLLLQVLPVPHLVSQILSPRTAELYESAHQTAGIEISDHPLSLDSFATFSKLVEYAAYFMIYLVLANGVPSRRYQRTILLFFLISASFQAVYGLVEFTSAHQHIFAYQKIVNTECATGTFINRNHYATYLEISLPLMFGLMAGYVERPRRSSIGFLKWLARISEAEGSKLMLFPLLTAAVLAGIICSLSRSGILFTAISGGAFFVLYSQVKKRISRGLFIFAFVLLALAITLGIVWAPLFSRFAKITTEFTAERARLALYKDTFRMFLSFPVVGTGAGTFIQVFPMYQSFVTGDWYRYAHNDYLQFLSEAGFAAFFILLSIIYRVARRLQDIMARPADKILLLQIGAFCSLLSLGLHSLTDFGIQIPAIALTGVAVSILFLRTPDGQDSIV